MPPYISISGSTTGRMFALTTLVLTRLNAKVVAANAPSPSGAGSATTLIPAAPSSVGACFGVSTGTLVSDILCLLRGARKLHDRTVRLGGCSSRGEGPLSAVLGLRERSSPPIAPGKRARARHDRPVEDADGGARGLYPHPAEARGSVAARARRTHRRLQPLPEPARAWAPPV